MFSSKNVITTGLLIFLILTSASYYAVDFYVRTTSDAIISSWLDSEALNLQQGNYLSSVAKSQRILLSSTFLNGLSLEKKQANGVLKLIQFGRVTEGNLPDCTNLRTETQTTGLFVYRFTHCFESDNAMRITFYSDNVFFRWIFVAVVVLVNSVLGLLAYSLSWVYRRELTILKALSDITRQVAHDIRSPLSALKIAASKIQKNSEEAIIIGAASDRLEQIASDLLTKSKAIAVDKLLEKRPLEKVNIAELLRQVVKEKLIVYPDGIVLDIPEVTENLTLRLLASDFLRVVSNIIENSLEAIQETPDGLVTVGLRKDGEYLQVLVLDNGKGIPPKLISKIGEKGITHGKENGSGLGLYAAKKFISDVGGKFSINSVQGRGTQVSLRFHID